MIEIQPEIKLSYVTGLRGIVLSEISHIEGVIVLRESDDSVYVSMNRDRIADIKRLKSVARAFITVQGSKYHPSYIVNHKSILGSIIEVVLAEGKGEFKSFKLSCAGSGSPEVRSIVEYVRETYKLVEQDEADLKIHINKPEDVWEIGIQITPRPLSLRDYKVENMSGAMDPTVAYALNSLCDLGNAKSYLNAFSGSGTLLIEAGLAYPGLETLVGFDNDKKHLSLAIQNIKKAGLIKRVQVKEADLHDKPELGSFDVIVSDLPFGMAISKGEDLEKLYGAFIKYAEEKLNPGGRMAVYTSEYDILERLLSESKFKIAKSLEVRAMTAAGAYLKTKVIVCNL